MRRFGLAVAPLAAGLLLAAAPAAPSQGGGGVSVAPMMVILDTRGRPQGFEVVNFSNRTETFRLDPLYAVIDADGVQGFEPATDQPGSAAGFLRWAPRQFEVPPGATRTVRLSARAPADLPPGEYRLHLRVTNIGPPPELDAPIDARGIGVSINLQVAQAVRVLVRHGVGPGTARLDAVNLEPAEAGSQLRFLLINNHDGGSVLGRYAVLVKGPDGAERTLLRTDITLYADTDRRPVSLSLERSELPSGARACVQFWSGRGETAPQEACASQIGPQAHNAGGTGHANQNTIVG
jgi:hypothetical protein